MLVFRRVARDGREVSVVLNFTPVARENFPIAVPTAGTYREIFNSDDMAYGGSGVINTGDLVTATHGERHTLSLRIPPMGCAILQATHPPVPKRASVSHSKASKPSAEARASFDPQ